MRKVLRWLLNAFRINGVDPRKQGFFSNILKLITTSGILFIFTTYILEMTLKWNGIKTLGKIYMFPAVCMMILKATTLQVKNKNLHEIITKIEAFVSFNRFEEKVEKRLNTIIEKNEKYTKIYLSMCMVVVAIYFVSSMISSDRTLYFDTYDMCDIYTQPCYTYYFIWQNMCLLLFSLSTVIGFDCLFLYFVTEAYCCFEVTKLMLREIRTENMSREQLEVFVKQHDEVMDYIKELNRLYSTLMLAQCWFSMTALILSLYVLTSEGIPPPLTLLAKYGMLYIFFAMQFFIYCLGGNIIMDQSRSVADVAFEIDWWSETRPELRRSLVLIIARSQRVEKICVGGIMDLNLLCFVKVLSNSLSAYTLLLTVEKKANMLQNNAP